MVRNYAAKLKKSFSNKREITETKGILVKVYNLPVEPHDIFLFYQREGKWTRVCDPHFPVQSSTNHTWNPEDKFVRKHSPGIDRIIVPSCCKLLPEHFNAFFEEHLIEQYKTLDKDFRGKFNQFVVYKHLPDGYIEVGLFAREGYTDNPNEYLTKVLNKKIKMKVFW